MWWDDAIELELPRYKYAPRDWVSFGGAAVQEQKTIANIQETTRKINKFIKMMLMTFAQLHSI